MTYYVEVRAWQARQGKPWFVPLSELVGKRGFRSVYAYPEAVRDHIAERGSSADLGGQPVYSDKLFLDFDDVGCADTIDALADMGVAFSVWTSGNRSFHIHVELAPMLGPDVPFSQKYWVQHSVPDKADLTFYTPSGQFRLPGTLHEKTKQRKVRLQTYVGEPLALPSVKQPTPRTGILRGGVEATFMVRVLRRQAEPGRRVYAWHLAKSAYEEGFSYEDALRSIHWWNQNRCEPPLSGEVLVSRVLQVYSKQAK